MPLFSHDHTTQVTEIGSLSATDVENMISLFRLFGLVTSKEDKFKTIHDSLSRNRTLYSNIARNYYLAKENEFQILDEIHLILPQQGLPDQLIDIRSIDQKLIYKDTTEPKVQIEPKNLPSKQSFVKNLIDVLYKENKEEAPYKDNFCYRLLSIDNDHSFTFGECSYFNYINTCEYGMFDFARHVLKKYSENKLDESTKVKLKKRLFDNPMDLQNRYAIAGINTLLVLLGDEPKCYIHDRSGERIAEAIGVNHVVPAGTFQPAHMDDGNHKHEFSMYYNIMREFGEELLGEAEELESPLQEFTNILERDKIRGFHELIEMGKAKVFYAGTAFDCLTLKPEILSIMVFNESDFEEVLGEHKLTSNYEGKHFSIQFNPEQLRRYKKRNMLPAGAGCLYMAEKNYDQIIHCLD